MPLCSTKRPVLRVQHSGRVCRHTSTRGHVSTHTHARTLQEACRKPSELGSWSAQVCCLGIKHRAQHSQQQQPPKPSGTAMRSFAGLLLLSGHVAHMQATPLPCRSHAVMPMPPVPSMSCQRYLKPISTIISQSPVNVTCCEPVGAKNCQPFGHQ